MLMDATIFPRLDELEKAALRCEPLKVAVAYPCSADFSPPLAMRRREE